MVSASQYPVRRTQNFSLNLLQIPQGGQTVLLQIFDDSTFMIKPQHHAGDLNLDLLASGLVAKSLPVDVQLQLIGLLNRTRIGNNTKETEVNRIAKENPGIRFGDNSRDI